MTIITKKRPDGMLEVTITGLFGQQFDFDKPCPTCDERGLLLVLTWTSSQLKLYLGGQLVETFTVH